VYGRDRRLEGVGAELPRRQGPLHQRPTLRDLPLIPARAVLVLQQHELARGGGPRHAPRLVEQHQGQQADHLRLRQQRHQQTAQADRLAREVGPRQRLPRGGRVPLVEHQVDHLEHGLQPFRQLGLGRHPVGDARVADLGLGAHDPLRHGGGGEEEGARHLVGGEPADLAQGQGHAGVGGQGGVAAGEDQPELVVLHVPLVPLGGVLRGGVDLLRVVLRQPLEPGAATQGVDRLEAAGRDQPRPGGGRNPLLRPLLQRGREGLVQRVLREIEVAQQADQGGEDAAGLRAVDGVQGVLDGGGGVVGHRADIVGRWTHIMPEKNPASALGRISDAGRQAQTRR